MGAAVKERDPASSGELKFDVYTEKGGLGPTVSIGTYTISDTINVSILVEQDCILEEKGNEKQSS
ncbi:hypothetical protein KEJ39_01195 [Candidatus Bathyarchaeota archaeon]|nr:hypothetical protein [Candidatus Bathyarchaeota archaeon]